MHESKKPNKCIGCTVVECKNHYKEQNYCSLQAIQVGTHEHTPSVEQCTDCKSFAK